jgi:hypothetical protein
MGARRWPAYNVPRHDDPVAKGAWAELVASCRRGLRRTTARFLPDLNLGGNFAVFLPYAGNRIVRSRAKSLILLASP